MQVDFTPEEEAQILRIANQSGANAEQLVREAALQLLQEDLRFREGVERGLADVERGAFVESSDVWSSVEEILRTR